MFHVYFHPRITQKIISPNEHPLSPLRKTMISYWQRPLLSLPRKRGLPLATRRTLIGRIPSRVEASRRFIHVVQRIGYDGLWHHERLISGLEKYRSSYALVHARGLFCPVLPRVPRRALCLVAWAAVMMIRSLPFVCALFPDMISYMFMGFFLIFNFWGGISIAAPASRSCPWSLAKFDLTAYSFLLSGSTLLLLYGAGAGRCIRHCHAMLG